MSNNRLDLAARQGNIQALHDLLLEDPRVLDRVDEERFADTPLHIAAREGNAEFAIEIAVLMPTFTRKLNPAGRSPMHEALLARQWKTVRSLMMLDPELIRVKGRGGKTPLHVAAKIVSSKQLLAEFLFVCPSSILDVTARRETAVHIAIRKENIDSFRVLFGWLIRVQNKDVLNWKDIDGNTALHLAVKASYKEVVKMLVKCVSIHAENFEGKTALDILMDKKAKGTQSGNWEEIKTILLGDSTKERLIRKMPTFPYKPLSLGKYYSSGPNRTEKWLRFLGFKPIETGDKKGEKSRDVVLLVAVLIATATYQAILTPPGGYWQEDSIPSSNITTTANATLSGNTTAGNSTNSTIDNSTNSTIDKGHYAGQVILRGPSLFFFVTFNSLAFFFSLVAIVTNIVELKQKLMLNAATLVLLITYTVSLALNLNRRKDSSADKYDWEKFRPVTVIPVITGIIGSVYIIIGMLVSVSNFYERLMDTQRRNICRLVESDKPPSSDISTASRFRFSTVFCCESSRA